MSTKTPQGRVIAKHIYDGQYEITWSIDAKGTHTIKYGYQFKIFSKKEDLDAAHEFGECIRHSAECAGLL